MWQILPNGSIKRKIILDGKDYHKNLCHNKQHISNWSTLRTMVFYIIKIINVSTMTAISNQLNHILNVILLINNKKFHWMSQKVRSSNQTMYINVEESFPMLAFMMLIIAIHTFHSNTKKLWGAVGIIIYEQMNTHSDILLLHRRTKVYK